MLRSRRRLGGSKRLRGAQQRLLCLTRFCAFREPRRRRGSAGRGLEVVAMARDRRLGLRVAGNGAGGPPYTTRELAQMPGDGVTRGSRTGNRIALRARGRVARAPSGRAAGFGLGLPALFGIASGGGRHRFPTRGERARCVAASDASLPSAADRASITAPQSIQGQPPKLLFHSRRGTADR